MHSLLSDCVSSDGSMDHPITMKPEKPSSKRRRDSNEPPGLMSDVISLRNEFLKIYEKDYPELQTCIDKLYEILKKFQQGNFRQAAERTRNGSAAAAVGVTGMLVGLALAPFTFGASIGVAVAGATATVGGGVYGGLNSSEKNKQMSQIRNEIEAELKKFQDKINPMSEKMKDINKRIEEILIDLDKLELEADEAGKDFGSRSINHNMTREEMTALMAQLSTTMKIIGTIAAIFGLFNVFLDLLSVIENTRELEEIEELANKSSRDYVDETKFRTKAGKFIVEMRKVIHKLENIMLEIRKLKDKLDDYIG